MKKYIKFWDLWLLYRIVFSWLNFRDRIEMLKIKEWFERLYIVRDVIKLLKIRDLVKREGWYIVKDLVRKVGILMGLIYKMYK